METPWYVTAVLVLLAALVTHYFSSKREITKHNQDAVSKWKSSARSALKEITTNSVNHFMTKDGIKNTSQSSTLIIFELKRFHALLFELACINPSDSKKTSDAYREYHECITGHQDFQNPERKAMSHDNLLFNQITLCEEKIISLINNKPRKVKT